MIIISWYAYWPNFWTSKNFEEALFTDKYPIKSGVSQNKLYVIERSRCYLLDVLAHKTAGVKSRLCSFKIDNTVRPRGTRPRGTQTSLGHDFKKGSKILAGHDFGTWTSRDTILKSAQKFLWFYTIFLKNIWTLFKIVSHKVHVPKSCSARIFEPFLKSCPSEVCVPRGCVPRGLTVLIIEILEYEFSFD